MICFGEVESSEAGLENAFLRLKSTVPWGNVYPPHSRATHVESVVGIRRKESMK